MMNEQVRKYFTTQKLVREWIVLEAVGTELKMHIDKSDIDFIHQVRILFKKQGNPEESAPNYHKILAAKYALLVANQNLNPPLHRYKKKMVGDRLEIYETSRKGGGQEFEDKLVGEIDEDAIDLYKRATGKTPANNNEVADWWIEENKNAIHDRAKGGKKSLPNPMVKIISFSGNRVSLAFRKMSKGANAKYGWYTVKDVYINMNKFHNKASAEGFNKNVHDSELLGYTKWDNILEPEKIGKGGKERNPNLEPKKVRMPDGSYQEVPHDDPNDPWMGERRTAVTKKHKGYISPGFYAADYNVSNKFVKLLKDNPEFEAHVRKIVAQQVISALYRTSEGNMVARVNDNLKVVQTFGIHPASVEDMIQEAYSGIIQKSGKVPDELWEKWDTWMKNIRADVNAPDYNIKTDINRWLRTTAFTVTANIVSKYMKHKKTVKSASALSRDDDSDFFANRAGGTPDTGDTDYYGHPFVNNLDIGAIADQLVKGLNDENTLKSDPEIITRVQELVKQNPLIGKELKKRGVDLNQLAMKHSSQTPRRPEPTRWQDLMGDDDDDQYENAYSFRNYFTKRIDEMGVVWGNDKNSAKILKPGKTLKGGIQVFGAPWTAGRTVKEATGVSALGASRDAFNASKGILNTGHGDVTHHVRALKSAESGNSAEAAMHHSRMIDFHAAESLRNMNAGNDAESKRHYEAMGPHIDAMNTHHELLNNFRQKSN